MRCTKWYGNIRGGGRNADPNDATRKGLTEFDLCVRVMEKRALAKDASLGTQALMWGNHLLSRVVDGTGRQV